MLDREIIIKCLDEHEFNPEPMDAEDAEWLVRGEIRGMPFIVVKPDTKEFIIVQRVVNIAENEEGVSGPFVNAFKKVVPFSTIFSKFGAIFL